MGTERCSRGLTQVCRAIGERQFGRAMPVRALSWHFSGTGRIHRSPECRIAELIDATTTSCLIETDTAKPLQHTSEVIAAHTPESCPSPMDPPFRLRDDAAPEEPAIQVHPGHD
jgi:hypothetical protein